MTKKRSRKLLIISLIITLTILLIAGISFFSKSNKENQMERSSSVNAKNSCSNCKEEISTSDKFCSFCGKQINYQGKVNYIQVAQKKTFCKQIKIQKTTSGKYFVNWWFDTVEDNSCYSEQGKNCFSAEKMPEILTLNQECWENNDWSGWEKELKDNYLLVKEKIKGENGQFQYQTRYEFHPTSQADREEEEAQQRIKQAERIREECKERARKWKEEYKNEWVNCSQCDKHFCLENEGSINNSTVRKNAGKPVEKTEYFCGKCSKK